MKRQTDRERETGEIGVEITENWGERTGQGTHESATSSEIKLKKSIIIKKKNSQFY